MNNNLDMTMSLNEERPWWSVRPALVATLAVLITLLVTVLSRPELLERSMPWYQQHLPQAKERAASHGLSGAWWPKMVGPEGRESPSTITPFLMWQQPHPILLAAERQLGEYFSGARTRFDLPLEPRGSEFQKKVWRALREIPFGETRSYLDIASRIGSIGSTRRKTR